MIEKIEEAIKSILKNPKLYNEQNFIQTEEFEEILSRIKVIMPNGKITCHYCTNAMFSLNKHVVPSYQQSMIAEFLKNKYFAQVEFIHGYINFKMSAAFFAEAAEHAMSDAIFPNIGHAQAVNVEYCSVNPTGFLHIGHARNAILGDAIARILSKANYKVTKEYYINDAGNQVKLLAESVYARFCEQNKIDYTFPEGGYVGAEIYDIAKLINPKNEPDMLAKIGETAVEYFITAIKQDLEAMRVHHDVWVSEKAIVESGYIEKAVKLLQEKGYLYEGTREDKKATKGKMENKPLMLLKTTMFGDDEDRPLTKGDGSWTYLAPDIGYHLNKIERGFNYLICILGGDHDNYAKRIKIAVKLLKEDIQHITPLCQMVSFEYNGQNVKFSKRMGNSLRTKDFIEEVPVDILRFMILSKTPGTPFVFDYESAMTLSMKNPVFYIQYAYARGCSILRNTNLEAKLHPNSQAFKTSEFHDVLVLISMFKSTVAEAALQLAPHTLVNYAHKLAEEMHKLWQMGKVDSTKRLIIDGNDAETATRLFFVHAFLRTMKEALDMLGISAPESMQ